ncbi:MAG: preprotein translocase subunit SecE [bacterium]
MASIIDKLSIFLGEVKNETKKVDWPTRQQTIKYTIIVIGFCLVVAIYLGGIDYAFGRFLNFLITRNPS